jgi:hypothetical protein
VLNEQQKQKVLRHITKHDLNQLTKNLSISRNETEIGEFVLDWYARHGIKPIRQEIDPSRINAVTKSSGRFEGPWFLAGQSS